MTKRPTDEPAPALDDIDDGEDHVGELAIPEHDVDLDTLTQERER